jgi:hypothetical protein
LENPEGFYESPNKFGSRFGHGIMSPDEYLGQLNALLSSIMARMRATLGEERFDIVFGDAGRHPEILVDKT